MTSPSFPTITPSGLKALENFNKLEYENSLFPLIVSPSAAVPIISTILLQSDLTGGGADIFPASLLAIIYKL